MNLGDNKWDYFKDKWPPHIEIGNGLSISPNISYSKAKQIHECPRKYAYAREIKPIEITLGYPILMGAVFDGLCSYGYDALKEDENVVAAIEKLTVGDIERIKSRYESFLPHRPEGEVQVPICKELLGGKWILIGFADMVVPATPDSDMLIVDWKWAMSSWHPKKFEAQKPQLHLYCFALDGTHARFIVGNNKTTAIQGLDGKYDVSPQPDDLHKIQQFLETSIYKIESGDRKGTPGEDACRWCDYKGMCPDIGG